jgi:ribosome-associated protein
MYSIPENYHIPLDDGELLAECKVTAFKASGPGGQHRNKSSTAVRLQHLPSGVVTIGKRERSQRQNLTGALERLRKKLEVLLHKPTPRKATKPSKGSKRKRLNEKKRRGDTKRGRSRVTGEE